MNRFWDILMLPIIEGIKANYIVEIGSDTGINTRNILEYCIDHDARMTAIDPLPGFDVDEFKAEYGDKFEIYKELSLSRLPLLKDYDVIIIDGDHNWYTVYNELKTIERQFKGKKFPLIFLHDVCWPYGRRDLYYNPENIPETQRQPYKKLGIYPGQSNLREKGGLNIGLNNAIYENNPQNGVLTAIEQFIDESELEFSFETIEAFFGLGILYPKNNQTEKLVKEVIENSGILGIVEEYYLKNQIHLNTKMRDMLSQKQTELFDIKEALEKAKKETLTAKNETLTAKNETFKTKNLLINEKKATVNEKRKYQKIEKKLNLIYSSDFWKVALKYYHIRDHVWPFNAAFNYLKKRNLKKAPNNSNTLNELKNPLKVNIKRENYKSDIIFLSIINYQHEYYQRPQHIADFFADNGHQVHYFNTDLSKNGTKVKDINKNLRTVNLASEEGYISRTNFSKDLNKVYAELDKYIESYDITDCVVFIEFPNWVYIGQYLKEKYGFKVVFDVLDEFSGFHPDDPILLKSFEDIFKITDLVTTTSEFLYEKCVQLHDNVKIVRNGVEFNHFNSYYSKNELNNKKPIIGYYGALAHWFDFELIEYVAKKRQEYDIILIGNTNDSDRLIIQKLENLSNVKFLGPKNYNELPHYLKKFDVALIPFKNDQDLIKATNPVKFYEYLSMGKKIVATEIPELMEYKDVFSYLTNTKKEFVNCIDKCVKLEDNLASEKEKIKFAKSQDWKGRIENIEKSIFELYDLVSIIIVTYNNMSYTQQCLESIFKETGYPKYEIIIVDNRSTDNTRRYLLKVQEKYDNVKVILNDENYGFAKANNIGINQSSGKYLVLLNNDTIVTAGWLSGLIKHLKRNPSLGLLGPVTNSISNEAKIKVEYTKIEDIRKFASKYRNAHLNELYLDINTLAMFCLAMPREVFEDIGPLDEIFTTGMFEDDDYSYRARKKGYEIACAEDVFIHHYGGTSFFKLGNEEYANLFEKNKNIFEEKWNIKWTPHIKRGK